MMGLNDNIKIPSYKGWEGFAQLIGIYSPTECIEWLQKELQHPEEGKIICYPSNNVGIAGKNPSNLYRVIWEIETIYGIIPPNEVNALFQHICSKTNINEFSKIKCPNEHHIIMIYRIEKTNDDMSLF